MSAVVARRYFVRGQEQARQGDLSGASASFAAALELVPGFVEARVGAALALVLQDPERAARLLRAGLPATGRSRRLLLLTLGDVLTAKGELAAAEAAYLAAAELPGPPLASRLARLYAQKGRHVEALAALAAAARG